MGEVDIFSESGVQVTTARFVVGHQMYPVASITSVAPFTVPPQRGGPIAAVVIGLLLAIPSFLGLLSGNSLLALVWLFATVSVAWGVYYTITRKAVHCVMITTSGMQARALATTDLALVHRVVAALNQAVASR